PPLSAGERLTAIFYEPARVFRNLRAYPHWLAPFIVIVVVTIVFQAAFTQRIGAETIASATIDKVIESGFIPADKVPEVREQALKSAKWIGTRLSGPIWAVTGTYIFMSIFAGLYMLGVLTSRARSKLWQAFCVAVYAAMPPSLLQHLLSLVILLLDSPDDLHPI